MTNNTGHQATEDEQKEVLHEFEMLELRISNAKDAFKKGGKFIESALFHLIHVRGEALDLIKQIGYPRYEPIITKVLQEREPKLDDLHTCNICGNPECQSDHK